MPQLWLTSIRSGVVIREGTTRRWGSGETKNYINGGSDRWDSILQLKEDTHKDKRPPRMDLSGVVTTVFVENVHSTWHEPSVPDVALPVQLKEGSWLSFSAPGGGTTVARMPPLEKSPPETVVGIPGRREHALDDTVRAWFEALPTCNQPASAQSRNERTQKFIARMTTEGDLPNFLRTFVPVWVSESLTIGGKSVPHQLVYYVMPDFLSVGNETNFVRLPLCASGGQVVADYYKCLQPTGKMAFQILKQRANRFNRYDTQLIKYHHFDPNVREGAPSTPYFVRQNALAERDRIRAGHVLGRLTAGHKKEIVVDMAMHKEHNPVTGEGRGLPVMFWGGMLSMPTVKNDVRHFHLSHPVNRKGEPASRGEDDGDITSSNSCHHNNHDEYAQGQRLVHPVCWLLGENKRWEEKKVEAVLTDSTLYSLLTRDRFTSDGELKYPAKVRLGDKGPAPWRSG